MEPDFYRETFVSEDWDWWHVGRRRILARVLDRALREQGLSPSDLRLLDVGCGTGGTTAFLGRGHRVVGCELEMLAARSCATRGLSVVRGNADALPFRDGSFDVVLCLDVLEHHHDDLGVAREVLRVLRPGGLLLATVPCFSFLWGPHDVLSHHVRRYVLPDFARLLRDAGADVVRASYFNALLFPVAAVVQFARRVARGGKPAGAASDLPQGGPGPVNSILREIFSSEAAWLARHDLPVGVSAFAIARKPGAAILREAA